MDINFELGDYKFVWDSDKADRNYSKHKVHFEDATLVFFDEHKMDYYDELHSDDEPRFKIVGKVGKVLVVIYTERGEKLRIISARQANKKEREDYYAQFYY